MVLAGVARVAIVGGGFSGTMLVLHLISEPHVEVVMIERAAARRGGGVAYSTSDHQHLLNVRASNMGAFPDQPEHFSQWLEARGMKGGGAFVTRATYGRYLRDLLDDAVQHHGARLRLVDDEVLDIAAHGSGVSLGLASGALIEADRAVLAVGNLPPHDPPGVDAASLPGHLYTADPWHGPIAAGLTSHQPVLVIGTGLTAIDVILRLAADRFAGPIIALSRRGLRPHRHDPDLAVPTKRYAKPASQLSAMVRWARQEAQHQDWRQAVDSLRPITQLIWSGATAGEQARFLRHLRAYWDIHRHRLAPAVADRVDAMVAAGQLAFTAGKIARIEAIGPHLQVEWRPRGATAPEVLLVARAINCTGPQGDLLRASDPLMRKLLGAGRIRADRHRLGLDVDDQCAVVDAQGRASDRIFAVGPMTRGDLWEVVAVPDIRIQVSALARRLVNAHWVGGEGL